jgi:hypothetical protein
MIGKCHHRQEQYKPDVKTQFKPQGADKSPEQMYGIFDHCGVTEMAPGDGAHPPKP